MIRKPKRKDLLYPDESYKIIGTLFDAYNTLGPGHHEKYYQRAIREAFRQRGIPFQEQAFYPLKYKGVIIGRQYADFIVFGSIVLEIKKGEHFSRRNIEQVLSYLQISGHKLAILANFGQNGLAFKRIVNFNHS